MTKKEIEILVRVIAPHLRDLIGRCTALEAEIATLRGQVAVAEQKHMTSGVAWRGVFRGSDVYDQGQLVTHGGALWRATRSTAGTTPGDSTGAFTLVCKKGAFDRSGR